MKGPNAVDALVTRDELGGLHQLFQIGKLCRTTTELHVDSSLRGSEQRS